MVTQWTRARDGDVSNASRLDGGDKAGPTTKVTTGINRSRIVLESQKDATQGRARAPDLNKQIFALGIPETTGCWQAMLVHFPEARIRWPGAGREGVVSCSCDLGGRIYYVERIVPTSVWMPSCCTEFR